DKYDFIAYWAVADMTDRYGNPTGEEKVISFRIPKSMIDGIKRQNKIFGNNVVDYADKVWIHPSLRE
ncbi:MAG: hypothetical protein LBF97_01620, partial [Elusimicrobiota bacterium]|nr:hypothetical protein [Elusimicrobiota bacterium]